MSKGSDSNLLLEVFDTKVKIEIAKATLKKKQKEFLDLYAEYREICGGEGGLRVSYSKIRSAKIRIV